jgi:hypothetical protein
MAPWLIALIFVAVVCGLAFLTDLRSRRKRRGLSRYSTSTPTSDALDAENRGRAHGGALDTSRYQSPF